ncbi:hypothetical protein NKR19_g8519 [Coniochaeta hoffmannii]|uniref:Uncharacterized protein n=1 Tax=Coniochaeta hoffmannii TaxID=91930 RepID=A0AA38VEL4_9PEZI|nr:hypothetical protein NKR19_g8519 [Coniochaeta hoffmannii]
MPHTAWSVLDEEDEAELHMSRLLDVEEMRFKRITKLFHTLTALAATTGRQAPTPPPKQHEKQPSNSIGTMNGKTTDIDEDDMGGLSGLREDIVIEFASFDSSIARLQFTVTANVRERNRYCASRGRIQDTMQPVQDNMPLLRQRLQVSRGTLRQRNRLDELAEKITNNQVLKPRADQVACLEVLDEECKQLEREKEEYNQMWRARRKQFELIMEESMKLRL